MKLTPKRYLGACAALALLALAWGAIAAGVDMTVPSGTTISVGDKVVWTVSNQPVTITVTPATQPAPPPVVVVPPPAPTLPQVAPGQSLAAAAKAGSFALKRGETYPISETLWLTRDNLTIGTYGEGRAPKLVITTNQRAISCVGRKAPVLDGLEITTTVKQHTESLVWLYNAPGARVEGCWIHGGNKGVTDQADNLTAGGTLTVEDSYLSDNSRQNVGGKDYHGAGIYCDKVVYFVRRCVFDSNGWRPSAGITRDEYSHGFYAQGTCGDGSVFEDNYCVNNSSHGAQLRNGGTFQRCLFEGNAIGFSYGLVNDSMIHSGGVKGSVSDVWVVGCPAIRSTLRPGWAGHFGNIDNVTVNGLYASDDDLGVNKAFLIQACRNPKNAGYVGVKRLVMNNLAAPKWARGVLGEMDGLHATPPVTYASVTGASLRAALAAGLPVSARIDARTAAAKGIAVCKAAWGVN